MKKCVKFFAMLASAATLFTGCLEGTSSNEPEVEKLSISSVKSLDYLPACTDANEGAEIYVEKEKASYVCAGKWLVSGSENTRKVTVSTSCITQETADGLGVKILCGGDSVGVVLNGTRGNQGDKGKKGDKGEPGADGAEGPKGDDGAQGPRGLTGNPGKDGANGKDGADGKDGQSCTVETLEDNAGLKVLCGSDSVGVVLNGQKGKDGKNGLPGAQGEPGTSCTMENLADGNGLKILCGDDSVAVVLNGVDGSNGTDAKNGTGCSVSQLSDKSGYKIVCAGDSVGVVKNGSDGVNGTDANDGTSCTVVKLDGDAGYKIMCGADSVGVVKSGANGKNGSDADDGVSCIVAPLKDATGYKILCGGDSVGVVKNGTNGINGTNGYDCSTELLQDGSGYKVVCNNDSIGVILNGSSGTNCTMVPLENGLGLKVMCGGDSVGVLLNTLGTCTEWREGVLETVKGKDYACSERNWLPLFDCIDDSAGVVKLYGAQQLICTADGWRTATPLEYDTYKVACSEEGLVKTGKVNVNAYYYCTGTSWREATTLESDTDGKVCNDTKSGSVVAGKVNAAVYYYCTGTAWRTATELEADTYGWADTTDGAVKKGAVTGKAYLFDAGESGWRLASYLEERIGGCTDAREAEVTHYASTYYICNSCEWFKAEPLEYDLYLQDCPKDGSRNGVVIRGNVRDTAYYYCYGGTWRTATMLERNVYGKTCSGDAALVPGEVVDSLMYVCDGGAFRLATERELELGLGCTSYTEGVTREQHYGQFWYSTNLCSESTWERTGFVQEENPPYETFTDARDGKEYKMVVIGEGENAQTWMAENLNFADSSKFRSLRGGKSACLSDDELNCDKYGRLYTWAAAMDSARTECGFGIYCTVTNPFQGICPDGWRMPTKEDWERLFINIGMSVSDSKWSKRLYDVGVSIAGKMLRSTTNDWVSAYHPEIFGMDAFGFSALPGGQRAEDGGYFSDGLATFWTTEQKSSASAIGISINDASDVASVGGGADVYDYKSLGRSVRCIKQ